MYIKKKIQVQYPPKVKISLIEGGLDTGLIPEGNIINLVCICDSNPSEVTYRWHLNDELLPDQNSKTLVSSSLIFFTLFKHFSSSFFFHTDNIQCNKRLSKFNC